MCDKITKKESEEMAANQLYDSSNYDKYRIGGEITSTVLEKILEITKAGMLSRTLCGIGDKLMEEELSKVYRNKKLPFGKGIAFPTCISRNNIVGYYIPDQIDIIESGDLVKIELGVHIDGFPSCVCYTHLVGQNDDKEDPYREKKLNLLRAVSKASKEVLKLMKPNKTNLDIGACLQKYSKEYKCNLLYLNNIEDMAPGIISYQVSRNTLDGKNDEKYGDYVHTFIIPLCKESYDFGVSESELNNNEVFMIDIAMSTGSGKIFSGTISPTIFARNYNEHKQLKLKSSRKVLSKFGYFPQSLINLCKETKEASVKIGLQECIRNNLVKPYHTFYERNGEYIARAKFTVIVKKKPKLITGKSLDGQLV